MDALSPFRTGAPSDLRRFASRPAPAADPGDGPRAQYLGRYRRRRSNGDLKRTATPCFRDRPGGGRWRREPMTALRGILVGPPENERGLAHGEASLRTWTSRARRAAAQVVRCPTITTRWYAGWPTTSTRC